MGLGLESSGAGLRERSLVSVAARATLGRDEELAAHLRGAVGNGLTHHELLEVVLQMGLYAGSPAPAASRVVGRVLAEDVANPGCPRWLTG